MSNTPKRRRAAGWALRNPPTTENPWPGANTDSRAVPAFRLRLRPRRFQQLTQSERALGAGRAGFPAGSPGGPVTPARPARERAPRKRPPVAPAALSLPAARCPAQAWTQGHQQHAPHHHPRARVRAPIPHPAFVDSPRDRRLCKFPLSLSFYEGHSRLRGQNASFPRVRPAHPLKITGQNDSLRSRQSCHSRLGGQKYLIKKKTTREREKERMSSKIKRGTSTAQRINYRKEKKRTPECQNLKQEGKLTGRPGGRGAPGESGSPSPAQATATWARAPLRGAGSPWPRLSSAGAPCYPTSVKGW